MRGATMLCAAGVLGLAVGVRGQILNDGNMNALTPGTNPDVGTPAGAWAFPANYVTGGVAELTASQFSIVPTSSFQPGAPGNSLRLMASLTNTQNIHLPNLFTAPINQTPGEIVVVQFNLWVASTPALTSGGGAIYIGGDHGGGGFNNATDRGPQLQWLTGPGGALAFTDPTGVNIPVMAMPYPIDSWQTIRIEIDLIADNYDLFFAPSGIPLFQIGTNLPFRSTTQNVLDRLTFVGFGATTPLVQSYLDDVTVTIIPGPGAIAVLAFAGIIARSRRRSA